MVARRRRRRDEELQAFALNFPDRANVDPTVGDCEYVNAEAALGLAFS